MAEKILVTQALDERDLLVKKIGDKISKLRLVDCKKHNEDRTATERMSADEFSKQAVSAYQQVMDLIDRYQRLDAAIIASNASTYVETSQGRYTVAAAIALRNRLKTKVCGSNTKGSDFEQSLISTLELQYKLHVEYADTRNRELEKQAEAMRLSILGKDSKVRDEKPLEVVTAYISENTTEVIDPLGAQKKAQELHEQVDALLKELDTQIKVSNATTMIEF